ncbi:MAG TPA: NAD-dependent epimerase/dehydratase family protein [Thermoleophilaceae bacterium]|nr:NAD-dependent epimerase/dehydratase family protein [Thermoleophilaceae bacterium]
MGEILVTGGAGFIGSHLVGALLAAGERVRVLDNLDRSAHPDGAPGRLDPEAELLQGDVGDRAAVDRALKGVDRVIHLAGVLGSDEHSVGLRRAFEANSAGTATLLEGVMAHRDTVKRLVAASSMVVYGEGAYDCPDHGVLTPPLRSQEQLVAGAWEPRCPQCHAELSPLPISEEAPLRPTTVYGITKRDQEELVLVLGRAQDLETVALRYFNVYGPGQALNNPYTGVAAIFAARLLADRPPLVFEDGRQMRDLVHVADVVRATVSALDAPAAPGHAINVGTGRPLEIAQLARRLASVLGSTLEPELTGECRAGDIRHCYADITLGQRLLGFEATTTLDNGLAELEDWISGQAIDWAAGELALEALRERGLVA